MHVLSNLSQSHIDPYTTQDACNHSYQPYYPQSEHMSDRPNGLAGTPGFTLLQGHIKLMAMVPNIPENHVSTRTWADKSVAATPSSSSQSLPPITPRFMPSIAERYWNHRHRRPFLTPSSSASKLPTISTGYYPQFSNHSSSSSFHNHLHRSPSSFHQSRTVVPSTPYDVPLDQQELQCGPIAYHEPSPLLQAKWPPPPQLACQMINDLPFNQFGYAQAPLEYPYSPYFHSGSSHCFQQAMQPPTACMIPYHSPEQMPLPPCSVRSMPNFFAAANPAYPPCHQLSFLNNYPVFPPSPPQHFTTLPQIFSSKSKTRISSRKTFRKSARTGKDDVYVVVKGVSSSPPTPTSSSLSSSDDDIHARRKAGKAEKIIGVKSTSTTTCKVETIVTETGGTGEISKPAVANVSTVPLAPLAEDNNNKKEVTTTSTTSELPLKDDTNNSQQQCSSNKTPKKDKLVVVTVHDCFQSDSSEVEEPDVPLEAAGKKRSSTSKLKLLKNTTKASVARKVFENLENDLNADEARTYTFEHLLELVAGSNWNDCYTALNMLVRLARHRPSVLLNHLSDNGLILWYTFNHITSPKSALCRAAILTFKEFFEKIPEALDSYLDKIVEKLVVKSLAPNRFIRVECQKTLVAVVEHGNLPKVLTALENVRRKPSIRAAGLKTALARMALQIVQIAGVDLCLMNKVYAEKLLPMLFCFMMEPNSEIRMTAKEALGMLMNHLQFEEAVLQYVTFDRNSAEVFKKLDKMRGRCSLIRSNYNKNNNHQR